MKNLFNGIIRGIINYCDTIFEFFIGNIYIVFGDANKSNYFLGIDSFNLCFLCLVIFPKKE